MREVHRIGHHSASLIAQNIDGPHLVRNGLVVDGADAIRKGGAAGEAQALFCAVHHPGDLIALYTSAQAGDGQVDLPIVRIAPRRRYFERACDCFALLQAQPYPPGIVAQIPDIPRLLRPFQGYAVQLHAPALEELGEILSGNPAGRHGEFLRDGIAWDTALAELLVYLIVEVAALVVIGQMELPVHAQADEYVIGHALRAHGGFLEDGRVFIAVLQPGGQGVAVPVVGLAVQGVDVVGDFRPAQGVHNVADLMGDAPAEQAVCLPGAGHTHRPAPCHAGGGAVADAHMTAAGVHERVPEHPHIADIVPGVLFRRIVDTVGFVEDRDQLLPGQHIVAEICSLLLAAAASDARKHLIRRQGQQHVGIGDFRAVADGCLTVCRGECVYVGGQLLHIGGDPLLLLSFAQAPIRKLQHGNLGDLAPYLELDFPGPVPCVLEIERASLFRILGGPAGQADHIAAIAQLDARAGHLVGVRVVLGRHQGDRLPLGNAGVHLEFLSVSGIGHQAQGLEGVDGLDIPPGIAGLHLIDHPSQGGGIPIQQASCQGELFLEGFLLDKVTVRVVQLGLQGGNAFLSGCGLHCREASVCEQGVDLGIDLAVRVESDLRHGDAGGRARPLMRLHLDLMDILRLGEGKDGVALHLHHAGHVLQLQGDVSCLVVGFDGELAQAGQVVRAFQPGHIGHIVHGVFLIVLEGENKPVALPEYTGSPVGGVIPVNDVVHAEPVGVLVHVHVVGIHHFYLGDVVIGNPVQGGELGRLDLRLFRNAGHGAGGPALADAVQGRDVDRVLHAVFQPADGCLGGGVGLFVIFHKGAVGLFLVVQVVGGGVLRRLPGDPQAPIQRFRLDEVRRQRRLAGQRNRLDLRGGAALNVAPEGMHNEEVFRQVFQPLNFQAGNLCV